MIKLFESFKSQKEIEKLTEDILMASAEVTLKQANDYIKMVEMNDEKTDRPIGGIAAVHVSEMLTKSKKIDNYDEMKDFILKGDIFVDFDLSNRSEHGSYFDTHITSFYTNDEIDELNDVFNNGGNTVDVIYNTIKNPHFNVIIHELQHAYDEWRSNGFAISHNKEFIENRKRANKIEKRFTDEGKISKNDYNFYMKHMIEYYNLKHETDAHFTQAVYKTQVLKDGELMKWSEYYDEFKNNFTEWDDLNDNNKKRITKKLAQFYQKELDIFNKE